MKNESDLPQRPIDLIPSLRAAVAAAGLNEQKLTVPLRVEAGTSTLWVGDRQRVPLHDGKKIAEWSAPALREMFRGNRPPPPDMNHYPPEYHGLFFFIEKHVLTVCDGHGDRTDQEMEEVYATLRRRPDGKSLGPVHDFFWQIAALTLGMHALSQAEFEAIFGQLARSTRHWQLAPVSRNYIGYLRQSFGAHSPSSIE